MSGFCSTIVPEPQSPDEPIIAGDGWWPDIAPADVRARMRIRDSVTPARLREALLAAIVTTGTNLAQWRATREAEGFTSLAAVPAPLLDGRSRFAWLYARAVACYAKAELVETYRDMDLTGAGQRQVDELDASVGELRRNANHAIRDILGTSRTFAELI